MCELELQRECNGCEGQKGRGSQFNSQAEALLVLVPEYHWKLTAERHSGLKFPTRKSTRSTQFKGPKVSP